MTAEQYRLFVVGVMVGAMLVWVARSRDAAVFGAVVIVNPDGSPVQFGREPLIMADLRIPAVEE